MSILHLLWRLRGQTYIYIIKRHRTPVTNNKNPVLIGSFKWKCESILPSGPCNPVYSNEYVYWHYASGHQSPNNLTLQKETINYSYSTKAEAGNWACGCAFYRSSTNLNAKSNRDYRGQRGPRSVCSLSRHLLSLLGKPSANAAGFHWSGNIVL